MVPAPSVQERERHRLCLKKAMKAKERKNNSTRDWGQATEGGPRSAPSSRRTNMGPSQVEVWMCLAVSSTGVGGILDPRGEYPELQRATWTSEGVRASS